MTARFAFALLAALVATGCASGQHHAAGGGESASSSRISDGMQRLGASEARGDCFARRISRSLNGEDEEEAATLVERAGSRDDMREGVLSASGPVKRAFIGANLGCSLFN